MTHPESASQSRGTPLYTVSVAASLTGMHAQTLRQYDRLGLISPMRAKGRGRRYSPEDVERLREIQRLSKEEGLNLAGVKRALELRDEVELLREEVARLKFQLAQMKTPTRGVFTADPHGRVTLRPHRRPPGDAKSSCSDLAAPHPFYWWYMRYAGHFAPVDAATLEGTE